MFAPLAGAAANRLTGVRQPSVQEMVLIQAMSVPVATPKDLPGALKTDPLPAQVFNTQFLPEVAEQQLNNCGAFAPSYYLKTYQEAREHNWGRPNVLFNPEQIMSPGFTYPLVNGGVDAGASVTYTMAVICRYGIAPWSVMPENRFDWFSYPREQAWRQAAPYRGERVLTFDPRTPEGFQAVKAWLAQGELLILSLHIFHDTYDAYPNGYGVDNGVIYANGLDFWDLHAFTIIGYDDTKTYVADGVPKTGAFLVVNSWGPNWGVSHPMVGTGGCVWFGYDFIQSVARQVGMAGMTDRLNYQPTDFLVMDIEHARACELGIQIGAGSPDTTTWLEAFPNSASLNPFSGRIVADITDFAGANPLSYWLRVTDHYVDAWPNITLGRLHYAHVEKGGGGQLPAQGLPRATVDDTTFLVPLGAYQAQPVYPNGLTLRYVTGAWADVDRDGDMDLAAAGHDATAPATSCARLFRNDEGVFREQDVQLPNPVGESTMAFGDYDGDGYPDLIFCFSDGTNVHTRLFRNHAGDAFLNSGIAFPGLAGARAAWGDYNNDGAPDLLLSGYAYTNGQWANYTRIFRNQRTNFVDSGVALPQVSYQPVSWVDFNNDGLLDCAVGEALFRQMEDGSFKAITATYEGGWRGSHAWRDYNGDGLPDLATTGIREVGMEPRIITRIYRNDGEMFYPGFEIPGWPPIEPSYALRLTVVATNLPGVYGGNLQWADMDHDGRTDLVVCGGKTDLSDLGGYTLILRQNADGSFSDTGAALAGFYEGLITAVDVDHDADLDLFVAGWSLGSAEAPVFSVYRSLVADTPAGLGRSNAPPAAPTGLGVWMATNAYTYFTWNPSTDDRTPQASLTYRMRVGRSPGAGDVLSPITAFPATVHADHACLPLVLPDYTPFLNTNAPAGLRLRGLAPGRYYWSVQAVDASGAASPWAPEQPVSIGNAGVMDGDLNADGFTDAADLVLGRHMLAGRAARNLSRADLNLNGLMDENDVRLLAMCVLGDSATTNFLPLNQATLGTAGGTVAVPGFQLTLPPGALPGDAQVTVGYSADNRPEGWRPGSGLYRVSGLPGTLSGTITLRVPDTRSSPTNPIVIAIGQMVPRREDATQLRRTFTLVTGTRDGSGWLVFNVPRELLWAPAASGGQRAVSPTGTKASGWTFEFDVGLFGDWYALRTTHFHIFWQGTTPAKILDLGQDLERAYRLFRDGGYPFEAARNMTNNPVQVTLVETADEGGCIFYTAASASIELKKSKVDSNDEMRRTTVCHEFFHLVQGLIHPSTGAAQAFDNQLKVLSDATATWSEELMATDRPTYVPPNYVENRERLFSGLSYSALEASPGRAGYAFSALIKHLVNRHGDTAVSNIYYHIRMGSNAVDALIAAFPGSAASSSWHDEFYRELVLGSTIYSGSPLLQISPRMLPEWPPDYCTADLALVTNRQTFWRPILPGLGAAGYRLTYATNRLNTIAPGEMLAFSLRNEVTADETLTVFTAQRTTEPLGTCAGVDYTSVPGVQRYRLTDLSHVFQPSPNPAMLAPRSVIALVTRSNPGRRDTLDFNTRLNVGVVREYGGVSNLIPQTVRNTIQGSCNNLWYSDAFPEFACSGTIDLTGLIGSYTNRLGKLSDNQDYQHVGVEAWQDGALTIPITFHCVPTTLTATFDRMPCSIERVTISNLRYEITKRSFTPPNDVLATDHPAGDSFTVALGPDEDSAYFSVRRQYTTTSERLDSNGVILSTSVFTNTAIIPLVVYLHRK